MITDSKPSAEASFRSSLEDVATIVERLAPHCGSVEEIIGMVRIALVSDDRLKQLMILVTAK